jgi:hypothetical protein
VALGLDLRDLLRLRLELRNPLSRLVQLLLEHACLVGPADDRTFQLVDALSEPVALGVQRGAERRRLLGAPPHLLPLRLQAILSGLELRLQVVSVGLDRHGVLRLRLELSL